MATMLEEKVTILAYTPFSQTISGFLNQMEYKLCSVFLIPMA